MRITLHHTADNIQRTGKTSLGYISRDTRSSGHIKHTDTVSALDGDKRENPAWPSKECEMHLRASLSDIRPVP